MDSINKFAHANELRWAGLMALVSTLVIAVIAVVDLNFDFSSGGFEQAKVQMKFAFFTLAIYLFIKIFTFLKKFPFWVLALFTLIFMIDFYIVFKVVQVFKGTDESVSWRNIYQILAGLNFLYIFILNLIPSKFFKTK
ncbi:hypothetical protein [Campylobacter sp.]|uniref:hypothetical protein n=1 Tax=Campylobacter sp. TaxID=205 RepID=UPI00270CB34F|nr:hypothetical protein [Campylobacter sp.]